MIFTEIIIPILETKNAVTFHQRYSLVKSFSKAFSEPDSGRILVEIYLNYDCDAESSDKENIWERLITVLTKLMSQSIPSDKNNQKQTSNVSPLASKHLDNTGIPQITSENMAYFSKEQVRDILANGGDIFDLKKGILELLSRGILASLVKWIHDRSGIEDFILSGAKSEVQALSENIYEEYKSLDNSSGDNPLAFESIKQKKLALIQGIQTFNIDWKRGVTHLQSSESLSKNPSDIAKFLFSTPGLKKAMIGEYLGDG